MINGPVNEQALSKMLKIRILKDPISLKPNDIRRDLGNLSKEIGMPVENIKIVLYPIMKDIFDDSLKEFKAGSN